MTLLRARTLVAVIAVLSLSIVGAREAAAQINLTSYVNNSANGATPLQVATGRAVQNMCTALTNQGYSATSGQGPSLASPLGDLYLRCNELVNTAQQIQGSTATRRSLGNGTDLLNGALQQVSGEEVTTSGVLATRASAGQFANIASRIATLRSGNIASRGTPYAFGGDALLASNPAIGDHSAMLDSGASISNAGYTPAVSAAPMMLTAAAAPGKQLQFAVSDGASGGGGRGVDRPWGWFAEGGYDTGRRKQTTDEDPFKFNATNLTVGIDYNLGTAVFGGSLGYDRFSSDIRASGLAVAAGSSDLDSKGASLFGALFRNRWSFNGIANFSKLSSDLTRVVNYSTGTGTTCTTPGTPSCGAVRTLVGSPDGRSTSLGLTASYASQMGGWDLSPSLSLSSRHVSFDSFAETELNPPSGGGGLALSYNDQSIDTLRSVLGLNLSRAFSRSFGVATPSFDLEWHHEYRDKARAIQAHYLADTALVAQFDMPTDDPDQDFGMVTAGVSLLFSKRMQVYAQYRGLIASQLSSNAATIGVRGQF